MIKTIRQTKIPGCFEIFPHIFTDDRGVFVKTFHKELFHCNNLVTDFSEEYYSISRKCVLRGLHFQLPPKDHAKLVYCVHGCVIDAVVDLRVGSPTFGQSETFHLSSAQANMIYIPSGLAHGFYVLSDYATLVYKVTTVYSEEHDSGILWNSAGIFWGKISPILSKRDRELPRFEEFKSPFYIKKEFSS